MKPLMLLASLALSMAVSSGTALAEAPPPSHAFDIVREGPSITVRAWATVPADRATVWRTLVDYARLPDFIPDMQSSELLERHGDDLLLRQVGRAGFGPFTRDFSLTLAVRELPMREVAARAVDGDFQRFESSYVLSTVDGTGATRIDYVASMEPRGGIPPLIGAPLMRRVMSRQFDALLAEVQRRTPPGQPPA
jgi:carbon monoxide dehydrogenase subunit G